MRLLLDTHLFLWFLADSPRLTEAARARITEADEVFVSAASVWEAAIKIGIGRLEVSAEELVAGIEASGFVELPVLARHGAAVARLPHHHRDPFDRLLLAQAVSEPLRFLTADALLAQYSDVVEVI